MYAAATAPRPGGIAEFDVHALKLTPGGSLVWARTYQAGLISFGFNEQPGTRNPCLLQLER